MRRERPGGRTGVLSVNVKGRSVYTGGLESFEDDVKIKTATV